MIFNQYKIYKKVSRKVNVGLLKVLSVQKTCWL